MKNYYEILEVKSDTSDEVIKAAYKALIKKYHPDNGSKNDPTGEKLRLVNEAYDVLSDPEKRRKYDIQLKSERKTTDTETVRSQQTQQRTAEQHPEPVYRENSKVEKKKSFFSEIISGVVDGVQNSIDSRKAEIENAYFEAGMMSDYGLIEDYKKSTGARRIGYAKELEKRQFLVRDSNGNWRPTEKYRYWK